MAFLDLVLDYIYSFFGLDLLFFGDSAGSVPDINNAQGWLNLIFGIITALLTLVNAHRLIYMAVGLFFKSPKFSKKHIKGNRYAFVLSARNEEKVIGNLIDSIHAQDYPSELIDIYLIADNCTDRTAEIAKARGCIVIRHDNPSERRKGYALRYFFNQKLAEYHELNYYYGYCIVDSDNVLAPNYLSKMNDALEDGYDYMIGYRNVKNTETNWVTAINGLNMYRVIVASQRPRDYLGNAQALCGTGFILRSHCLKDGWNYTSLSEDCELNIHLASNNLKGGFCEEAIFYDEQPESLRITFRQRIRWARGLLTAWLKRNLEITKALFKKPTWRKHDMYWEVFPYALLTTLLSLLYQTISLSLFIAGVTSAGYNWMNFWSFVLSLTVWAYLGGFLLGVIVIIREWKKIHMGFGRAVLMSFIWPLYDLVSAPITILSIFWRVEWKTIPHHVVKDPNELLAEEAEKARPKKI